MTRGRSARRQALRRIVTAGVVFAACGWPVAGALSGSTVGASPEHRPAQALPRVVGQLGGPTYAAAALGDYLVAGVGPRLIVYAVCDRRAPLFASQTEILPAVVQDVTVDGRIAYVALGDAGLGVVDLGDLAAPRLSTLIPLPGSAGLLATGDGRLYVGAGTGGVRILDLGDPWAPREIGVYDKIVSDLAVVGQHIYAVQRNLTVVDVSDPTAPREWTKLEDWADAVTTDGRILYVGASTQGPQGTRHASLHVYDLGVHPRRPPLIGQMPLGGPVRNMRHVAGDEGSEVWLLEPGAFRTVYVRAPASPVTLAVASVPATSSRLVALGADAVAVAAGVDGWFIASSDLDWAIDSALEDLGSAGAVASWDGLAFVESEGTNPRIVVVDASEPQRLRAIARMSVDVAHKAIAASDGYLYVGSTDRQLRVFDVRTPMRPRLTATHPLPDEAWSLDVTRGRLYVANDASLRVFDLSAPGTPAETGSTPTTGGATDVVGGDGFAFVTGPTTRSQAGSPSVQVVDARIPGRMREISSAPAAGWRDGLAHLDPYVFVGGLQVIDVTDLAGPREAARIDMDADSRDSVLVGAGLYVAQKTRGGGGQVAAFDVAQPAAAVLRTTVDTIDGAVSIGASWGTLHVAAGEAGLVVVETDASRPAPTPTSWPGPPLNEQVVLPFIVRGAVGRLCP